MKSCSSMAYDPIERILKDPLEYISGILTQSLSLWVSPIIVKPLDFNTNFSCLKISRNIPPIANFLLLREQTMSRILRKCLNTSSSYKTPKRLWIWLSSMQMHKTSGVLLLLPFRGSGLNRSSGEHTMAGLSMHPTHFTSKFTTKSQQDGWDFYSPIDFWCRTWELRRAHAWAISKLRIQLRSGFISQALWHTAGVYCENTVSSHDRLSF